MYPDGFVRERDRKRPICGVLAVAIAAKVSFDVAFEACKRNMPKHRQRMRGSTYKEQRDAALRELAVKFTVINTEQSVRDFCQVRQDDGYVYILEVRGHVLTLRDGAIIDQSRYCIWQDYARQHPRMKLKRAVRIDGKGW